MTKSKPEPLLWLNDARGVYIPRDFANCFVDRDDHVSGVSAEEWQTLENGPDDDSYWDTWNDVEQNAIVTDDSGTKYRLYQDSDLWLVPVGMEWNDQTESFEWPDDAEPEYEYEDKLADDGNPLAIGDIWKDDKPREKKYRALPDGSFIRDVDD